ncbi:hypothetical protein UWK_01457 [Desulfocapsa sulfexigens DSM 10523]|uniref:Uncharacterized protein n=1 Tax=Desulfocapsa sulfexigens (strain DSM 10523 / SB164P1) TaxID=1167006 RepID=M1P8Q1_DESSD|nr:hypothetical protein [Desulfocapsa sulfexigens]AGF78017.1 hypothetical protein UWK_01457 [Desulfocapsa sulfexigens DSM 10523]
MKVSVLLLSIFLILHSVAFASDRPSNEMPMYGGANKSHIQPDKKLSRETAQLGWKYFYKGDHDTAIKRFNQAWMFDHNNLDALWGFGLIMGNRAAQEDPLFNINESINYLNLAKSMAPENGLILGDLAYSYTFLGSYLKEKDKNPHESFIKAEKLFQEATKIEPKHPLILLNWSILEYQKGNYSKAKKPLDKAKGYGFRPDPAYEKQLLEKL